MKKFYQLKEKFKNRKTSLIAKLVFIVTGIVSTVWFLMRVIPKPQRAGYPCMKAAAPIMSGFIMYLLTLGGLALLFRRTFTKLKENKYNAAIISFIFFLIVVFVFSINDSKLINANPAGITAVNPVTWDSTLPDGRNNPMGVGRGIFPGRVAWVWNPGATNPNCTQAITDAFFMPKNNVQDTINRMADKAIKAVGGKATVRESWDAIFKHFNKEKTGTEAGYTAGQTIFIKVNNGQAGWSINSSDLSAKGQSSYMTGKKNIAISETSPGPVLAIIRQLVDSCGVAQENIMVAEPMSHVYKHMYDVIHTAYPNVKVLDKDNKTSLGRTTSAGWQDKSITWSDKGTVMNTAITDDMMKEMYNADYLINIAPLKAHARSGITLTAKNHFGSSSHNKSYGASALHSGSINVSAMSGAGVVNGGNDNLTNCRGNYKMYRVLTDIMAHPKIGRNTVLFVVDGLWSGIEATDMPVKWTIAPFKNNWPNSLFISQDEVAIQSVCLDFLRAEAKVNTLFNNRPFFPAVDDFIHQAADSTQWPSGIKYDPGLTGQKFVSLGVHEHWNNDSLKQYTKDLKTGNGIELFKILSSSSAQDTTTKPNSVGAIKIIDNVVVSPNPAKSESSISYSLKSDANVSIYIVSMDGKIAQNIKKARLKAGSYTDKINAGELKSGIYVCVLKTFDGVKTVKLIIE